MIQKQKMSIIIHQTLLLWLSEYQVIAISFQNNKEIVYKFILEPFYRICCPLFCQLCDIDCLFVVFNLSASNIKFAVCFIGSAAHQNNSATFWAYSVSDTICCFFKLLYALVIAADFPDDTKCMFIKSAGELYYLLKPLFILTASAKAL